MIRRIVVPLDRSPLAERALAPALAIARRTGAELRLVHVRAHAPADATHDPSELARRSSRALEEARGYLDLVAVRLRQDAGVAVTCATVRGAVAEAICADAAATGADLIVMCTHGRTGWSRFWIGSVADAVLHRARIPVLLVRASDGRNDGTTEPPFAPQRVLVPMDGGPGSDRLLEDVAEILGPFEPDVELIEVVAPLKVATYAPVVGVPLMTPDAEATEATMRIARRFLVLAAQRLRELRPALHVTTAAVIDEPATQSIVDAALHADVVALVSHGRGASRLFVGSVCDRLLRSADAALLVLPIASVSQQPALLPPRTRSLVAT